MCRTCHFGPVEKNIDKLLYIIDAVLIRVIFAEQ